MPVALGNNLSKKYTKLVTLFYRIWYIIIYDLERDWFFIIELWLDLHKHNKFNSLLNRPKKVQEQLDKGLAESIN